jgi:hypothetical protein
MAILGVAGLSLLLGAPLRAEIPKQGKVTVRIAFSATLQRSEFGKDKLTIADLKGVQTSKTGEGVGHNMSISCIGVTDSGAGTTIAYCTLTDLDGDQIFRKSERSGSLGVSQDKPGKWQWTGGTGKYTGISGGGTLVVTYLKSSAPGTAQGYTDEEGEYKLP